MASSDLLSISIRSGVAVAHLTLGSKVSISSSGKRQWRYIALLPGLSDPGTGKLYGLPGSGGGCSSRARSMAGELNLTILANWAAKLEYVKERVSRPETVEDQGGRGETEGTGADINRG
jgi:hypothetical protein